MKTSMPILSTQHLFRNTAKQSKVALITGITEVETLLGDPTKAKQKLGWVPEITAQEMCKEMVVSDLAHAKQHALLKRHGYSVNVSLE